MLNVYQYLFSLKEMSFQEVGLKGDTHFKGLWLLAPKSIHLPTSPNSSFLLS